MVSPARVALTPATFTMKSGRKTTALRKPAPSTKVAAMLSATTRLRKRRRSTTGSAARRSVRTNSTVPASDRPNRPRRSGDAQPGAPPAPAPPSSWPTLRREQERHHRDDEPEGAGEVEPRLLARAPAEGRHARGHEPHRHRAQRHVDEEHPVPAEAVGEEAADERADHARHAEHRAHEPGVLAAHGGREDVGDHGERAREQPRGAEPLHGRARR
jgi:hypothetical protein